MTAVETKEAARVLPLALILNTVASFYNLDRASIEGPSRLMHVTLARHVAVYLALRFTPRGLRDIGMQLGGRDHSTIHHSARVVKRKLKSDPLLSQQVDWIIERLKKPATEHC